MPIQTIIRPGDILMRKKGWHDHVGVAWFDGQVLHNAPWRGEHLSTLREFAAGHRIRVRATEPKRQGQILANGRAVLSAPRGYHLLRNNCEHTAHYVTAGRPRSPQLLRWTLVGLFGALVALW